MSPFLGPKDGSRSPKPEVAGSFWASEPVACDCWKCIIAIFRSPLSCIIQHLRYTKIALILSFLWPLQDVAAFGKEKGLPRAHLCFRRLPSRPAPSLLIPSHFNHFCLVHNKGTAGGKKIFGKSLKGWMKFIQCTPYGLTFSRLGKHFYWG